MTVRPVTCGVRRGTRRRAALDVEIVCSDAAEHKRRVELREPDIAGHALPTWQDVVERDYHDWDRDRLVVDTAASDFTAGVRAIVGHLPAQGMTHVSEVITRPRS